MDIAKLLDGTLDVNKVTVAEIDAFAAEKGIEVSGAKRDKLNQLADALDIKGDAPPIPNTPPAAPPAPAKGKHLRGQNLSPAMRK